jgi:SAM-dependent methyltransferase
MPEMDRVEGRRLFGGDPPGYDQARPDYPIRVYNVVREKCRLARTSRVLEIGAGTGRVTRSLIELGADHIVAVEPDESLAAYLASATKDSGVSVDVRVAAFEDVKLPNSWFDLAVAASSFHWVDQTVGPRKVANVLRPGGWWVMWWNVLGDPSQPDPFYEATADLLSDLAKSPWAGTQGRLAFALDVEARKAALRTVASFRKIDHEIIRWTAHFDAAQTKALYATFASISRLEDSEREALLERNMITAIYAAQRSHNSADQA